MKMNAWVVKQFFRLFHVDTTNNKRDIKEIKKSSYISHKKATLLAHKNTAK